MIQSWDIPECFSNDNCLDLKIINNYNTIGFVSAKGG
jgi:hypothetical protein